MGVITSAELVKSVAPGLAGVFLRQWARLKPIYTELCNMDKSTRQYEQTLTIAGFGAMPSAAKGSTVTYDSAKEAYTSTWTHLTYKLAYRVEQEAFEDEMYGWIKQLPKELADSGMEAREVAVANIFNRGFSDSYVGGDSEPFFGDETTRLHPRKDGGTWRNTLSAAADLDEVSLNDMLVQIRKTVNERGITILPIPKVLWVAVENEKNANQLVKSTLEPYTAENQINYYKGMLEVKVNPYFTDADACFIECQKHDLKYYQRVALGQEAGVDFDSGDLKHKARQRFSVTWGDPRGWFGVEGA